MSIQYPVLNSNPRPLEYESPPITTRPGTNPIKILQRKFYSTKIFKHQGS